MHCRFTWNKVVITAKTSQLSHASSLATFCRDLHAINMPMLGTVYSVEVRRLGPRGEETAYAELRLMFEADVSTAGNSNCFL